MSRISFLFVFLCTFISCGKDNSTAGTQLIVTSQQEDVRQDSSVYHDDSSNQPKDGWQFTCNNCNDGNLCTEDDCDNVTGLCTFDPIKDCCLNDSDCDDEDICSEDHCDEDEHLCYHLNVENTCCNSNCDDDDLCTIDECIGEESCVHTPTCDDDIPCTDDGCDSITGACSNTPLDELCDDGHLATIEQCNIETGACDYAVTPGMCLISFTGWETNEVSLFDRCSSCQPDISQTEFSPVDCDDSNPCTDDGCDPTPCTPDNPTCNKKESGCTHEPIEGCCLNNSDCDDGNVCNGEEACDDNKCNAGTPSDCDDGNVCNGTETCDPKTGCQPGTAPDDCCTSDKECSNKCWMATCIAGTCSTPEPMTCDDSDTCNGLETCNPETGCASGTPLDCNDKDPCTDDNCNSETGVCMHEPIEDCCTSNNECTDEDSCNGTETCTDNTCISNTPPDCSDGNPCTDDICNSKTGACSHEPVNDCCVSDDDCAGGDVCKGIWTCVGGQCKQGDKLDCTDDDACTLDICKDGVCDHMTLICNDDNPCTADVCETTTGCIFTPNTDPCDDDDVCTKSDICNEGACKGTANDCDDGNPCTDDSCDPKTGACLHKPVNNCCTSDDECSNNDIICMTVTCIEGVCTPGNIDDGTDCNDNNNCTQNDACLEGTCSGEEVTCDDNNPCTTDICKSDTGCIFTPNTDPCDDDDACTEGDICSEGVCNGTVTDCDDENICSTDICQDGACMHEMIVGCCSANADCNDDDACTLDVCFNGACQQLPITGCCTDDAGCDDTVSCTIDACEGNLCVHTGDNTLCDDNDVCNGTETCDPKTGCQPGDTLVCDDGNLCTDDSCDPMAGCTYVDNTLPCENGNPCTINDTCVDGTCTPGESPCTDNGNMCNIVSCEPAPFGHNCTTTHTDAPCDDGNPCTKDVCKAPTKSCEHYPVIPCNP